MKKTILLLASAATLAATQPTLAESVLVNIDVAGVTGSKLTFDNLMDTDGNQTDYKLTINGTVHTGATFGNFFNKDVNTYKGDMTGKPGYYLYSQNEAAMNEFTDTLGLSGNDFSYLAQFAQPGRMNTLTGNLVLDGFKGGEDVTLYMFMSFTDTAVRQLKSTGGTGTFSVASYNGDGFAIMDSLGNNSDWGNAKASDLTLFKWEGKINDNTNSLTIGTSNGNQTGFAAAGFKINNAVPEPSTACLSLLGLGALLLRRRRKTNAQASK